MAKIDRGRRALRISSRPLIVLCLGVAAAQAPAQPEGRTAPIIVAAEPLVPAAARDRAMRFLRATGVAVGETPAARWAAPVCPRVLGLTAEAARAAEATMRAIADEAGAEVASEPCDSNIVVMFTPDAGAVVREIARREPRRLEQVDPGPRRTLLTGSAPIRWWHISETRASDGGDDGGIGRSSAAQLRATRPGSGGGSDLGPDVPTMLQYRNSIISTLSERRLLSATVVIDQDAVMGRRLNALAAYAALVSLAEIRPGDLSPQGSILGMFAGGDPPRGLTTQDMGFLRALYRVPLDRHARHHRGVLVGAMVDATTAGRN